MWRPRDWRDEWNADEWREAWGFMWLVVGCGVAASAELRTRLSFSEAWERIAGYRNRLVATLNEVIERRGEHGSIQVQMALGPEIRACDRDLTELRVACYQRAYDNETLERATLRKILEHGIKPRDYARWRRPDLDGDEDAIHESSERVTAQQERTTLRRFYERGLAVCLDLFESASSGCDVFIPRGEIFEDRYERRYRSRWPTPMDLAREIERLNGLIARLSQRMNKTNSR